MRALLLVDRVEERGPQPSCCLLRDCLTTLQLDLASLLNAANEKQDTHTGPYGLVKIKSLDSNDTNWMVRGYRTLRKMLPAIRELPFLNMEAFDGILVTVVTEDDQMQVIKLPEGTELLCIWTLSGRASLQWGEGQLRVQGSISKLSVKAEETDVITVRLFSRDAVLGLAYQVGERKPTAIVKEANRAGLTLRQPDEAPMKKYGDPVLKTDALDIGRHRIRTHQEEDPEIHPYMVLFEQGMGELRKKCGQKTAELTNRHKDDYKMVDGILTRWVNLRTGRRRTSRHGHPRWRHQVDEHQRPEASADMESMDASPRAQHGSRRTRRCRWSRIQDPLRGMVE